MEDVAKAIASYLEGQVVRRGPVIVGLDGPDCAGKSTLAQLLVGILKDRLRILCVHQDDYLNPSQARGDRENLDVDIFLDSFFDQSTVRCTILDPFSKPPLRGSIFDVVLVEGLFLFRPPLGDSFNIKIRMEIGDELLLERALRRDVGVLGDVGWVRRHYTKQAIPAQQIYRELYDPLSAADVVVDIDGEEGLSIRFAGSAARCDSAEQ